MAAQATSDTERLNRFLTIGVVYKSMGQYDSAKVYLEPVFEKDSNNASIVAKYLRDIALAEGDTLKASQYSQVLAEVAAAAPENLFRASQLNDLFQNYLQKKQEKAEAERKLAEQEAARLRWRRGLAVTVVVMMALGLGRPRRRPGTRRSNSFRRRWMMPCNNFRHKRTMPCSRRGRCCRSGRTRFIARRWGTAWSASWRSLRRLILRPWSSWPLPTLI